MAAAPLLTSAACTEVFLAACRSVEFRSSSPSPHGTGWGNWHLCQPCTPGRTCPEQTAAGEAGALVLTYCHAQIHWPKMVRAPQRGHVWTGAWMSTLTTSLNSSALIFLLDLASLKIAKISPSFVDVCSNSYSCSDCSPRNKSKWKRKVWRNVICDVGNPRWHVNLMSCHKLRRFGCDPCFTPVYNKLGCDQPIKEIFK